MKLVLAVRREGKIAEAQLYTHAFTHKGRCPLKGTKQTVVKKFCHNVDKRQTNVGTSGIMSRHPLTDTDEDSYLSPIPCKTPGILWSRYSKINSNNEDMK